MEDLGVGGGRCRPDAGSGGCGEVLGQRQRRRPHGGESLRSGDEAGERSEDAGSSSDQQEWNEGPGPLLRRKNEGGRAEIERESINFMGRHLDEGMKEVC